MGIDEAGEDDFAGAIDFSDAPAVLFQPGIAESVFGGADGHNSATEAQNRAPFDDGEFFEIEATPWTGLV